MSRRLSVVVILLAVLVGGLVLDRVEDDPDLEVTAVPADPGAVAGAAAFPVASESTSLSSTWFCAGGTADEEAFADHVITMLNPTEAPMTVTVTAFPGTIAPAPANPASEDDPDAQDDPEAEVDPEAETDETGSEDTESEDTESEDTESDDTDADDTGSEGTATEETAVSTEPVERTVELPALTRRRLAMTELVQAPIASALVESETGSLVVEHEVSSIHGTDAKPCATTAGDEWHFAWGTTERDARELLVLFNPFPDDAIVEGRFATEDGVREPVRFASGIVVPGRSSIAVDLGDDVTRRAEVAGTLTARTGRIVVDRIVRVDAEGGDRGLTVQLGVAEPQVAWVFPDGFAVAADEEAPVTETFVVYNPGDTTAEVNIELTLDRPEENGIPAPVELSLPPGSQATVDLTADGRVPAGVAHSAVVQSANGVPVVAERVLSSRGTGRRGITVTTGSPVEAEEWYFAAGATTESSDEWLILLNLDPLVLSEVDVLAIVNGQEVPVSELQGLVVEAGERAAIRLGERLQRDDLALVVRASEPLVAERGLYRVGEDQRGTSNAIGIPLAGTLRIPGDPLDIEVDAGIGDSDLDDPDLDDPDLDDPGDDVVDDDSPPTAPDDVELPDPDETIEFDDPDAEADVPAGGDEDGSTTTTTANGGDETPATTEGGVPDTTPAADG